MAVTTRKEDDGLSGEAGLMERKTPDAVQTRIHLDAKMLSRFSEYIYQGDLSQLVHERGLPYSLVYNLAHGRIRSLSRRDYRIIFGEDPPEQAVQRVDGLRFRGMVRLWLFLNEDVTKADLYRKLFAGKHFKKVDYRIFTGQVRTVDARLEELMKAYFLDQGLEWAEVKDWIEELDQVDEEKRMTYSSIKPVLEYLQRHLEVNSSRVLNQCAHRYESGELKTVPKEVYDCALRLKTRTEKALRSGSRFQLEKLKEDIYGKRKRLILYAHIREELEFLHKFGRKSPGRYLGRSMSKYEKLHLKRVASWRAEKIREDALRLIRERPDIPAVFLPSAHRQVYFGGLLSAMRRVAETRMMGEKDRSLEEEVLTPSFTRTEELRRDGDSRVRVDQSAQFLGMSKKAFDLMVGANSHIFRKVAIYDGSWYLPGRYLKELGAKKDFALVRAKYKLLAKETSR
jgi:hypothetical protein